MTTAKTGRPPQDCKDLAEVRVEIDRVDAALVDLLAERWKYVDRMWELKRAEAAAAAAEPRLRAGRQSASAPRVRSLSRPPAPTGAIEPGL